MVTDPITNQAQCRVTMPTTTPRRQPTDLWTDCVKFTFWPRGQGHNKDLASLIVVIVSAVGYADIPRRHLFLKRIYHDKWQKQKSSGSAVT